MPAVKMEKKKKILLVDDLKEFTGLIKVFLAREFEIRITDDGLHALSILNDGFRPDTIITDLIMPKLDGYQLIEKLNSEDDLKDIPVIVLTGLDRNNAEKKLQSVNFLGIVGKPFVSDDLSRELIPLLKQATSTYQSE